MKCVGAGGPSSDEGRDRLKHDLLARAYCLRRPKHDSLFLWRHGPFSESVQSRLTEGHEMLDDYPWDD